MLIEMKRKGGLPDPPEEKLNERINDTSIHSICQGKKPPLISRRDKLQRLTDSITDDLQRSTGNVPDVSRQNRNGAQTNKKFDPNNCYAKIPATLIKVALSFKSDHAKGLFLLVMQRAEPVENKENIMDFKFKDKYFLLPFKDIAPLLGITMMQTYTKVINILIKAGIIVRLKTKTGRMRQYKMAPQWIKKEENR